MPPLLIHFPDCPHSSLPLSSQAPLLLLCFLFHLWKQLSLHFCPQGSLLPLLQHTSNHLSSWILQRHPQTNLFNFELIIKLSCPLIKSPCLYSSWPPSRAPGLPRSPRQEPSSPEGPGSKAPPQVSLQGNLPLQWFLAAQQPPHLQVSWGLRGRPHSPGDSLPCLSHAGLLQRAPFAPGLPIGLPRATQRCVAARSP